LEPADIKRTYGNKVRIRVCGIAIEGDKILMLKHQPLGPLGYLWSPPGGGVEFGIPMEAQLEKEFLEETNLKVQVGKMMFVNEYIDQPIHAIEVFFRVRIVEGILTKGHDPELSPQHQMIKEVAFRSFEELKKLDPLAVHNSLRHCSNMEQFLNLNGFFIFHNY